MVSILFKEEAMKKFWTRIEYSKCLIALYVTIISLLTASQALATSNIVFILDASGSMNGKIGNEIKMTAAKRVLSNLLNELPTDSQVGLMAYGHTVSKERAGACEDIAILSPIGQAEPSALAQKVNSLRPMGMTPIASSLARSVEAFKGAHEGDNHVVLISDGLETCGKDPCRASRALTEANINARVHVVGFDVGAREAKELACIPKMGNGKYFRANNAEELKLAIAEVKKVTDVAEVVVEPKVVEVPKVVETPKPPEPEPSASPEPKIWFEDNFDGEELADHWEVINPNPNGFIVEDGNLLVVTGAAGHLPEENVENLFLLHKNLPKGDWSITMRVKAVPQAKAETIILGLYQGKDDYILSKPLFRDFHWTSILIALQTISRSRGKDVSFTKNIYVGNKTHVDGVGTDWAKEVNHLPQPLLVRLEKRGRQYVSMIKLEGLEKPAWVEMEKLTVLRAKGQPVIGFYQDKHSYKGNGQASIEIEWIKIEAIEKAK
jgi:hypothetical protein